MTDIVIYSILSAFIFSAITSGIDYLRSERKLRRWERERKEAIKRNAMFRKIGFMVENYDPIDTVPYSAPITKAEAEQNEQIMFWFIERHPNSKFFSDHPEYVDKYLAQVDISEITKLT